MFGPRKKGIFSNKPSKGKIYDNRLDSSSWYTVLGSSYWNQSNVIRNIAGGPSHASSVLVCKSRVVEMQLVTTSLRPWSPDTNYCVVSVKLSLLALVLL